MKKRLVLSLIGGSILGVFCIIGAYVRSDFSATRTFVFALWYNRFIMGLVIGAPWKGGAKSTRILRGGLLGLLISFAFYSTTAFKDPVSFFAGIIYGIILELILEKFENQGRKSYE